MAWEAWTQKWARGAVWGQTPENTDFQAVIIGWVRLEETLRGPQWGQTTVGPAQMSMPVGFTPDNVLLLLF